MTVRDVLFLLGGALMLLALLLPIGSRFRTTEPTVWFTWLWLFCLGLMLAVMAHGWPDRIS
jgi:hypothetical protein